ncbi:MAG: hypothetical protein NTZ07_03795 [Candidatus Woesebacteria bacterium]|nr:hypothetical protein [Candidatus Woesebacteria bacterium]
MSNRLKYLKEASRSPKPTTQYIDTKAAREMQLIFGFKNLDLDRKPFNCTPGEGESLLYTIKTLHHFSKMARKQIDLGTDTCHPVPDDQIKKHNLFNFVLMSPSRKLHQLGRSRTPQRIVGYYESPNIFLFQVCLFDLKHHLSD